MFIYICLSFVNNDASNTDNGQDYSTAIFLLCEQYIVIWDPV